MQIWDYFMHALGLLESPCGSTHSLEEFTHLNKLHLPLYYTIVDNLEKEWCEMLGNPNAPGIFPQHQFVSSVRNQWMRKERNAVVGFLQSTQVLIDGADVGFCNRRRKNMMKEPQQKKKSVCQEMKYKFTNSENNSGVLIQMQADNAWSYYLLQKATTFTYYFWQPVNWRLLYSFLTLILWRVIILLSHFLKHSCLDNCRYINNVLRSRSFSSQSKDKLCEKFVLSCFSFGV